MSDNMFSKKDLSLKSPTLDIEALKESLAKLDLKFSETTGAQCTPDKFNASWGSLDNPVNHNPSEYRYLVHAINPSAKLSMPIVFLTAARDGGYDTSRETMERMQIDLSTSPERVSERPLLSMSLIDQDHPATWGAAGLILRVPAENIIITSVGDCGSINFDINAMKKRGEQTSQLSAEQLLNVSSPYSYNEVVAEGSTVHGNIEVTGFFYKTTPGGKVANEHLRDTFRMQAAKLGLPFIEIKEKSFGQDGISSDHEKGTFAVMLGGVRYLITSINPDLNFNIVDGENVYFMNPEDAFKIRDYLAGLPESERNGMTIEKFDEIYEAAKLTRHSPRIRRNDDGEILNITWKEGYEDSTTTYRIGKKSFMAVNAKLEYASFQESMSGGIIKMDRDNIYRYLPASMAIEKIRDSEVMTDKEKEEAIAWIDQEQMEKNYQLETERNRLRYDSFGMRFSFK